MNFFQLKNKNILVTGGAGFIGSNLCEFLLKLESNVICLDNLSTGYKKNIQNFIENKRFKFIEGDIRNYETCLKFTKNIDFVLHQAALGSVPRSFRDPISTNDVNINGFLNMLVASKKNKVKRFVYAASSSVYGDSKLMPKIESKIGKPLSPYAITKYVNEIYADLFSKSYEIETVGLRYFNVFGKRQDPNGAYAAVIPKFIMQLMKGKSPTINGDGKNSRDFTYIDNVVQANMLSLVTNNLKGSNQIYNIAYGEKNSLNDLKVILKKNLTVFDSNISKIKFKYGPKVEGDIPHSHANIDKAIKYLNYKPQFDLKKGIKKSVNWYWENLKD